MSEVSLGRRLVERPWLVSLTLILVLAAWLAIGQLKAQDEASLSSSPNPMTRLLLR